MIKNIKIGEKEVQLDNNIGWTMIYKDQFGADIIQTIMPVMAAALDLIAGLVRETGKKENITWTDILKLTDGDTLLEAAAHFAAAEFVDFLNITWALAKNADDSVPDPRKWIRSFDTFPVDEIAPEVVKIIFAGMVSSKNQKWLNDQIKTVQAIKSTSTPSSSQESSED